MSLLYMGVGRSVFIGRHPDLEMHHHATLQISFSLDQSFSFHTPDLSWTRVSGVAIASNARHQFRAFPGVGVSLHVVPEARHIRHLDDGFLGGASHRQLDGHFLAPYIEFFRRTLEEPPECSEVILKIEHLINDLTGTKGLSILVDERVLAALDMIERDLPGHISLKTLARHVCLSEDRFLHLFTEQLGLPLRPYVLNRRLLCAAAEILAGCSVTQAAVNAGFCDAAHFSRTFHRYTGLHPSIVKTYRGAVKVSACSSARCIRPTALDPKGDRCVSCVLNRPPSSPRK